MTPANVGLFFPSPFPHIKLCYWCLHSMSLLGASVPPDLASDVIDFLSRCQAPTGGFGGQ